MLKRDASDSSARRHGGCRPSGPSCMFSSFLSYVSTSSLAPTYATVCDLESEFTHLLRQGRALTASRARLQSHRRGPAQRPLIIDTLRYIGASPPTPFLSTRTCCAPFQLRRSRFYPTTVDPTLTCCALPRHLAHPCSPLASRTRSTSPFPRIHNGNLCQGT